ncbi:rCG35415 [Rattus norvegicus]|uniref:RCG35415 n=1 Tax=Rattus norvegicus TaxID=10116 RepID=A6HIT7_RAT|nr:rCG35415 [Rattus norvegicus]
MRRASGRHMCQPLTPDAPDWLRYSEGATQASLSEDREKEQS